MNLRCILPTFGDEENATIVWADKVKVRVIPDGYTTAYVYYWNDIRFKPREKSDINELKGQNEK